MHKLLDMVCDELDKMSEIGISSSNLDRILKLSQIKDALMDSDYKETKKYMMDSSGDYSRDYPTSSTRTFGFAPNDDDPYHKYMESKKAYRFSHTPETKRNLLRDLEAYMEEYTGDLQGLMKDSECQEERMMMQKYLAKMRDMK